MSVSEYLLTVLKINFIDNQGIKRVLFADGMKVYKFDLYDFLRDHVFGEKRLENTLNNPSKDFASRTFQDVKVSGNTIGFVL